MASSKKNSDPEASSIADKFNLPFELTKCETDELPQSKKTSAPFLFAGGRGSNGGLSRTPSDSASEKHKDKKDKKLYKIFGPKKKTTVGAGHEIGTPLLVSHNGLTQEFSQIDGPNRIELAAERIKELMMTDKYMTAVKVEPKNSEGKFRVDTDDELDERDDEPSSKSEPRATKSSEDSGIEKDSKLAHSAGDITAGPQVPDSKGFSPQKPPKPTRTFTKAGDLTEAQMVEQLISGVSNDDFKSRFPNQTLIGSGASAKVYKSYDTKRIDVHTDDPEERAVAIKQLVLANQKKRAYVVSEIQVMAKIHHENIVNLVGYYLTENHRKLQIVMEFLWSSLTDVILDNEELIGEENTRFVTREVFKGIEYLHRNNIVHRDIKSDNVLLGLNGAVKVADFGFCAELSSPATQRMTQLGTPYWMPPEIANKKPYSPNVDVWSIGIMVIEMIDRSPPYMDDENFRNPHQAILQIAKLREPPPVQRWDECSEELRYFLHRCLTVNAQIRPSAREMLSDKFLQPTGYTREDFADFLGSLNLGN